MNSPLQRLLRAVDPARTYGECTRRADDALNTFPMPAARITDWYRFHACLVRFMQHLDHHLLRLPPSAPTDVEMHWSRCLRVLVGIYGDSGAMAAFECARTGNEDGLYGVLRTFAHRLADEYALAEIKAQVWAFWDNLSVPAKLAATDEYLRIAGHLVPGEMAEGSAARIRANLPKVLIEHPKLLRQLQQAVRR
jgi:hypothetical protein